MLKVLLPAVGSENSDRPMRHLIVIGTREMRTIASLVLNSVITKVAPSSEYPCDAGQT